MHETWREVVRAVRALRRAPGFTFAAMLALGIGVGGSTVVFSVVDTLLLRPLPYSKPETLVVAQPGPTWEIYERWRDGNTVFRQIAAYNERAANVAGAGEAERVTIARVTPNFLSVAGVRPAIGHDFSAEQVRGGNEHVALVSDAFWRKHYAASPSAVGRTLSVDDQSYTIVGVLPPDFLTLIQMMPARGLTFDWGAAMLVPLVNSPFARDPTSTDRMFRGINAIARLRDGVSLERARAEVASIARRVPQPAFIKHDYTVVPLRDFVAGELPAQMAMLAAAVGLLLLVACANVANLLLARATGRRREMATRVALGASTLQTVRPAIAETMVLAAAGAALGVLGAWGGTTLVTAYGGDVLARLDAVGVDLRVLVFSVAVSLACGLLVGVFPALRAARLAPAASLRAARGSGQDRTDRLAIPSLLVVFEVVLSLVLAVGAGLLVRDFRRLMAEDLGIRSGGVLMADVSLSRTRYPRRPQAARFLDDLLSRAASLPAVDAASLSSVPPGAFAVTTVNATVEGGAAHPAVTDRRLALPEGLELMVAVAGDYFRTVGIPMVQGRPLGTRDQPNTERVVVVSAAFARKYWDGPAGALGHRIIWDEPYTIVGVAGDVRWVGSTSPPFPLIYFPFPQAQSLAPQMTLLLHSRGDPRTLAAPLVRLIRAMNAEQPLYNVQTLDRVLATQRARPRLIMTMMTAFGVLALLLAAVGVYSVMSYAVAQRAHEIGVRLAIGGSRRGVFGLVLRRGIALVAVGVALGLPLAFALTRLMASQLTGVSRTDPATYVATAALVVAVGLAGCAAPAWRATRVDPIVTLRAE